MNTTLALKHFFKDGGVADFSGDISVTLEDILSALSTERRFANEVPWTVLQHSLSTGLTAMSISCSLPVVQHAYCHDFTEAFVRDVPTPVKHAIGPDWYRVESLVEEKIFRALGIPLTLDAGASELVKAIDRTMCCLEFAYYFDDPESLEHWELRPDEALVAVCGDAFNEVRNYGEIASNGVVDKHIVEMFNDVIYNRPHHFVV
jgi:5'-deoxynucleotidase YfbR-like HD superfamily hydrolase